MNPPPSNPPSSVEFPVQFDIIVVGAGAAGLYAALCLPAHLRVGLITKDALNIGASDWAQGGIAAAIDSGDSPALHFEDTIRAGAGLCDAEAVKFLVENARSAISALVEMGVAFDRKGEKLAMTLEAAHSRPRVLHAADTTGRAIVSTLTAKVLERPNIRVLSEAFALNLWLEGDRRRCVGISLLYQSQIRWIRASAVIIATGGGGRVYAQTTNPEGSTGDGVALAWRAGALLRDLEFVQFHPTALNKPGAPHFLISEAVRGEGAHLVDKFGRRFVFDYHHAGELAPRDVVSRAIFMHLQKTASDLQTGCVYLDLRSIPADRIAYRFPNIIQVCRHWGVDVFAEPIPVVPAAHYWMGGIAVDTSSRTSIAGLYALGETTNTGVHGANRLASNSLLECIVYAARFSQIEVEAISPFSQECLPSITEAGNWQEDIARIEWVRQNLPVSIWQSAGICRTRAAMEEALALVESWRSKFFTFPLSAYLFSLPPRQDVRFSSPSAEAELRLAAETWNLLDIGYLILKSALFRCESRGGHYRLDYPEPSPDWQMHTLVRGEMLWKSQ